MSYKHRWTEPRDRETRAEYRALRRGLKSSRTSKSRRLEIEARLDEIAAKKPESILSELPPAKPTNKDLQALCTRVEEAKRRKSIPSAVRPAGLEAFLAKMVPEHARQVCADPVRRRNNAAHHIAITTGNLLYPENVLWEMLTWNRGFPHPSRNAAADKWIADLFAEVGRRDAADPGWYFRVLVESPEATPAVNRTVQPSKLPAPPSAPEAETANPVEQPESSLMQRTNLVLAADPHLARLAAHAPEYDSGIRAAITKQLQEHGFADGAFLAGLYNASRPNNLSAFPPRSF